MASSSTSTSPSLQASTALPPAIHLDSPPHSPTSAVAMTSPPTSPGPQPSPVFAPRPMRIPQPFRPRPLVALEGSAGNQMRTPSPKQQRRSSSAASSMKNLVLTDSKLVGGETTEVQVKLGDEGENSTGTGELQPMQLYSPSKDVLDELYKIIRNNKPPRTFGDIASHRRQLSDSSSKDNSAREENTRSPLSHEFGRIAFRERSCHPSSNKYSDTNYGGKHSFISRLQNLDAESDHLQFAVRTRAALTICTCRSFSLYSSSSLFMLYVCHLYHISLLNPLFCHWETE